MFQDTANDGRFLFTGLPSGQYRLRAEKTGFRVLVRSLVLPGVAAEPLRLVFDDPFALSVQDRVAGREERWQTLGLAGGAVLLLVAHTYIDESGEETIRIISARRATARERTAYQEVADYSP